MGCAAPLAAQTSERRERRVVSVLFADLVGFTSRSERLDIEDVGELLSSYQQLLRGEVESCGGVVSDFAGDGMMAIFGAPKAHEDDPERAVRAGIAICELMGEAAGALDAEPGLRVRVGIASGEALVSFGGARELDATGDIVNTASRLQTAAPPGSVLVDEATYTATTRVIRHERSEPVIAKGKEAPVPAWLALEPRSLVPEQVREQLVLVGREREADLLRNLLERSRSEPSTELVTIIGPPGIGKTRLVSELDLYVEMVPDLITWRAGRSLAYGAGVAFWALGEMVKAQAGIIESDAAVVAGEKLRDAVTAVLVEQRDRQWVERHLRPLVGLDVEATLSAEDGRGEAFAAWRRFFESLAEDSATVLVFEDVHWADDALLDFIDLLADRAGAVPLLIVCTARPELLERRPGWGGGKTNTSTVSLSPLSGDDTARLVAQLLDQALLPAELQQALVARAEGNPFYAQEYVRMLQGQGLLVHEAGGWRLEGEAAGLPESVHGIVAARLDTLAPAEKAFIQDAAVLGRTGWLGGVCALGDRSSWQAQESLHQLERAQLLRRNRRSSVEGEVEFAFSHALTQEVAYGQIPRGERAARHERAAAWIEQLAGRRDDRAELLAHHYATALELRRQAGREIADLAPRARLAAIEAGHQAKALTAHRTAARHFALALELTGPDDPERAPLLFDYAIALSHAGMPDEALIEQALNAQLAAEDWERAAWMENALAEWSAFRLADGERADAHFARAATYSARVPTRPIAGIVAAARAYRLMIGAGQTSQALEFANEALNHSESTDGHALLLCRRGWARLGLGDIGGIEDTREGCRVLAELAHPRTGLEYANLAEDLAGLAISARQRRSPLRRHADGDELLNSAYSRTLRGRIVLARGEWRSCRSSAAGRADRRGGGRDLPPESRMKHAISAMAERDYERAAGLYGAIGSRPAEARAFALAAESALGDGRRDDAARSAALALAFYREVSATLYAAEIEQLLSAVSGSQQGAAG